MVREVPTKTQRNYARERLEHSGCRDKNADYFNRLRGSFFSENRGGWAALPCRFSRITILSIWKSTAQG